METIGLLLNVIGVLPALVAVLFWFVRFRGGRRFLRLSARGPIDVVLTTSAVTTSTHGAPVVRPLTGIGQVDSIAFFARALGTHYRKKPLRIHMSSQLRTRLDADLVVIGGPAKNRIAREFLDALMRTFPELQLQFDDIERTLEIAGVDAVATFDPFDGPHEGGFPVRDLGIIVGWRNPYSSKWRRGYLCAGFTTFGTAAASDYLFTEVLGRHTDLAGIFSAVTPRKPYARCFVEVIGARFSEGVQYAIERLPGGYIELDTSRDIASSVLSQPQHGADGSPPLTVDEVAHRFGDSALPAAWQREARETIEQPIAGSIEAPPEVSER